MEVPRCLSHIQRVREATAWSTASAGVPGTRACLSATTGEYALHVSSTAFAPAAMASRTRAANYRGGCVMPEPHRALHADRLTRRAALDVPHLPRRRRDG
jgi:hypothetical protein